VPGRQVADQPETGDLLRHQCSTLNLELGGTAETRPAEHGRGVRKALGIAYINPHSLICGRLISRKTDIILDRSLLELV